MYYETGNYFKKVPFIWYLFQFDLQISGNQEILCSFWKHLLLWPCYDQVVSDYVISAHTLEASFSHELFSVSHVALSFLGSAIFERTCHFKRDFKTYFDLQAQICIQNCRSH